MSLNEEEHKIKIVDGIDSRKLVKWALKRRDETTGLKILVKFAKDYLSASLYDARTKTPIEDVYRLYVEVCTRVDAIAVDTYVFRDYLNEVFDITEIMSTDGVLKWRGLKFNAMKYQDENQRELSSEKIIKPQDLELLLALYKTDNFNYDRYDYDECDACLVRKPIKFVLTMGMSKYNICQSCGLLLFKSCQRLEAGIVD